MAKKANAANTNGRARLAKFRHLMVLVTCDVLILVLVNLFVLTVFPNSFSGLQWSGRIKQIIFCAACILCCRFASNIYRAVWRYGGSELYLKLFFSDAVAGCVCFAVQKVSRIETATFIHTVSVISLNLLATMMSRLTYQFLYEYSNRNLRWSKMTKKMLSGFVGTKSHAYHNGDTAERHLSDDRKINIAIVGAGRVGAMLASELINNPSSIYKPCCFIDIDREKIGRYIFGLPIFLEGEDDGMIMSKYKIQEIVLALPNMQSERKKELYDKYKETGCRIKVYDYPLTQNLEYGKKRQLREFDIEELLFRRQVSFIDANTRAYYAGKTILISGGGGSIGSELCRQIAKMKPKKLIALDVYENGVYDIQQELRIAYNGKMDLEVEIASICDRAALERIFDTYRPDIVLHAAAHKHVPLMEHNCCEAVHNNVFGTLNMVEVSEKYNVSKFTLISTDKAVNPTNVMGTTKRLCEMIIQSKKYTKTNFSATRFGNVLGSNGSVIPLFRRQIAAGGPVTITDKRIIRYFMTIPEAVQLVLQSGAMAKNGEMYVLDMGRPVKILELAESMIRLSGLEPYKDIDIIETGLRPGEKLYEELLTKSESLERTMNDMLFIEREPPLSSAQIRQKLQVLRDALKTGDDMVMRDALKQTVKTYRSPEDVNEQVNSMVETKLSAG